MPLLNLSLTSLFLQNFCHPLVPPLVFISRGGEDHLTPAMAQGKVGDGSYWQGMVSCFLHHGGMVCVGMGSAGFLGQVGWKERVGKNISKIFFSPVSAFCRGEKAAPCCLKQHLAVFFFKENKNKFRSDPKMGYGNDLNISFLDISFQLLHFISRDI
jgi:hypothetical protein